jgi:hypothetical protein
MAQIKIWFASHFRALLKGLLMFFALVLGELCLVYLWASYTMANPPHSSYRAVLADLDGDGDLDGLLANGVNEGRSESTLWINQGEAQGGRPGAFVVSSQRLGIAEYRTVATGDLDSDGDLDILLGNTWFGLEMFINQGGAQGGETGLFYTGKTFSGGDIWGGPHPIGLGDLDSDGDLDIVTGNCCGGLMMHENAEPERIPAFNMLWINLKAEASLSQIENEPSFQPVRLPQEDMDGTQAVALGDLDGDGDLDAFLAKTMETNGPNDEYNLRTSYRVWWNDGAGSFSAGDLDLACPNVEDLALGDLDGDGDLDVLAATRSGGQVILNQGRVQRGTPGQFAISPGSLGSLFTTSVFLGDLNGDGSLDALLGSAGRAQIWLNDGGGYSGGNFRQSPVTLRYPRRDAVALGDIDGDGDLDVFTAHLAEHYRVWINNGNGRFTARGR